MPARRFVFPNWPLFAQLVWVGGLLGVGVAGYLSPRTHTVFPIYAIAARDWVAGQPDLYVLQPQTIEFYRYGPAFAVATIPFAFLSPEWGNGLFILLNGAAFAVGLWVWVRHGLGWRPTPDQSAAVLLVVAVVIPLSLATAQANMVMTGLVLLGLTAAAHDRWWAAGFAMAAATLVKVFPLALALVLAVVYWRRFPVKFAVALVVLLAIPFLTQTPGYVADRYVEWVEHLRQSDEFNRIRLRNLSKLFELAGSPVPANVFRLMAMAAGGVVLLVGLVPDGRRERLTRLLAWFSVWALLYSPGTENATYAILAPSLAEAFVRHRWWLSRVVLGVVIVLAGPANTDLFGRFAKILGEQFGGPALGAVLFQGWLVGELIARWRAGPSPDTPTASPGAIDMAANGRPAH